PRPSRLVFLVDPGLGLRSFNPRLLMRYSRFLRGGPHLDEVRHLSDHAPDDGVVFLDHGVVHALDTKRAQRAAMVGRRADAALYLGDLELGHDHASPAAGLSAGVPLVAAA